MKKNFIAYLQLSLGMFFAGSTVVVSKSIVMLPIAISQVISLICAVIVLFPAAYIKEGRLEDFKAVKQDMVLMFMQAVTGLFLFRILIILGLRYTSAVAASIVTSMTPAVLAVLAVIFLREKLNNKAVTAVFLCMAGMILINLGSISDTAAKASASLAGSGLIFLAVVGEALFTIFRKKQSFQDKPITVSAIIMLFALLLFLPGALVELQAFNLSQLAPKNVLALIYYGLFGSAAAYICWFSGIGKVNASTAAGFSGVMPLSSVLLSVLFLREKVTWQHMVGMTITLIGIYNMMSIDLKKEKNP